MSEREQEQKLEQLFAELRGHDESTAPAFARLRQDEARGLPSWRPTWRIVPALAAVAAVVVGLWAVLPSGPTPVTPVDAAAPAPSRVVLTQWQLSLPLDALLAPPAGMVLSDVPDFDRATHTLALNWPATATNSPGGRDENAHSPRSSSSDAGLGRLRGER